MILRGYHQWNDACMGNGSTSSDFSYSGRLSEVLLPGVVANRFPGQKLSATNLKAENPHLKRMPREGFQIAGL